MKTRVAVISIIIRDKNEVEKINEMLHEASDYIIGRMGIPYRQKNINLISVAVDAPEGVISALSGSIGQLPGVTVKTAYSDVITETP
ncbi:TM1266 family iron-only hydrogenase system putative regulator [uncultured Pseudoramibacter sp.]|jgi:putative iron-only hydrogenase system regulator|uniref:Iron-only hydrogenase system regulator n=1 Tax=Candidatus Pseudoramibacter fermentans TaxID=2594427 RepID=A0A6L5GRT9_9FIRM|nr:TM1266 family iron-only hydrogenase system putative regulator [uncultured Pseudoramibacter sp.]MQM72560.1 iron-only hydrogenase system regulator [Candidatus Pseudoramibacter fermentans]RRF91867.1 MAG: iron-only hydrogenase system regulator [Eubacteriaceae bacterium]